MMLCYHTLYPPATLHVWLRGRQRLTPILQPFCHTPHPFLCLPCCPLHPHTPLCPLPSLLPRCLLWSMATSWRC